MPGNHFTHPLSAPPFQLDPSAQYRVLSLHGQWAWSIIYAGKGIENRSWSTPHRGTILIHASSHREGKRTLPHVRNVIATCSGLPLDSIPVEFPTSAIIGAVDVDDCIQDSTSPWAYEGNWHWVLKNPRPLERPITGVDGKLNLWTWPNAGAPASTKVSAPAVVQPPPTPPVAPHSSDALTLELHLDDAKAECVMRDGEFVILAGSTARAKALDSLPDGLRNERKRLRRSGILVPVEGAESLLRFSRDSTFGSPSAAAGIVSGTSLNGRAVWKVKGEGISLKDWQDRQRKDV